MLLILTLLTLGQSGPLDEVNKLRQKVNLPPYLYDRRLTLSAERVVKFRAEQQIQLHTRNDFHFLIPGAVAKATGCGRNYEWQGWLTCHVYETRYTYAGAAQVTDKFGRKYMQLFLR